MEFGCGFVLKQVESTGWCYFKLDILLNMKSAMVRFEREMTDGLHLLFVIPHQWYGVPR